MSLFRCLSRSGVMKRSDLSQIFRSERFPANLMSQYINLLSKFEVALPWSPEFLLVPSLLPDSQQETNLPVAAGVSAAVAQAMNVTAYTQSKVLRRQYVMSYVPSGFWPRLITRWAFTNFFTEYTPTFVTFYSFPRFFPLYILFRWGPPTFLSCIFIPCWRFPLVKKLLTLLSYAFRC